MMINDDVYETAVGAIELAARAPSIHNSQPWQCLLTDETLQLYAARDRWLPATDADRRDLMLSCGAMLHHLVVALRATGLEPRVHRLPNEAVENHVAAIELRDGSASDADIDLARAMCSAPPPTIGCPSCGRAKR
jgi:predicted amidohydrolase YtcJ